jgi:predicted nucleic acid-binding protein
MTKQVYSIESYQFNSRDGVLFDANIWMYIYGPPSHISSQYRYAYTSALRRIRGAGCPIVLDALVLSEFINAYARFFYNKLPTGNKPTDYKLFRNSSHFKPVAEQIARRARKILEKSEPTRSRFNAAEIVSILTEYAGGEADFNDQVLAELCRADNLKLVTHDADFSGSNLTILTANPKLLIEQ